MARRVAIFSIALLLAGSAAFATPKIDTLVSRDLGKEFHMKHPLRLEITQGEAPGVDADPLPLNICFSSPTEPADCSEVHFNQFDSAKVVMLRPGLKGLVISAREWTGTSSEPGGTMIWVPNGNWLDQILTIEDRDGETKVLTDGALRGFVVSANPVWEGGMTYRWAPTRNTISVYRLSEEARPRYVEVLEYVTLRKYAVDEHAGDYIDPELPAIKRDLLFLYPGSKFSRSPGAK